MISIIGPNIRGAFLAVLLLAGCGNGAEAGGQARADGSGPDQWTIGPIIDGRNYSKGVPLHPIPGPAGAWHIDLPQAPGSVHYVTFRHGSLAGKTRIVMRYRVDADPGVRIVPLTGPNQPSIITLYFQRSGDDWSGVGPFEAYRWYATFASQMPIAPGEHEMVAPLSGNWTAVERSSAKTQPGAFRAAVMEADQVGFVLGGGTGYGHGVYATGRARLTILAFKVE
ncbi:MAG TPA: hypothetical protein VH331_05380 [Allosphingosinicella sp.]|jgi:hypothetical protein|nr:hypothetical protein [Allosphingosinicella sp.]